MTSPYNERDLGTARDHDQNLAGIDTGALGDLANQTVHRAERAVEGAFESAAHEAGRLGQTAADRARSAADAAKNATKRVQRGLSHGADWVKQHDASEMWDEMQGLARRHPGKSMLAVAAVGFLVGRSLRRSR